MDYGRCIPPPTPVGCIGSGYTPFSTAAVPPKSDLPLNIPGRAILPPGRSVAEPRNGPLPSYIVNCISILWSIALGPGQSIRALTGLFHVKHPSTEVQPSSHTARVVALFSSSARVDRTYHVLRPAATLNAGVTVRTASSSPQTLFARWWKGIRVKQCAHDDSRTPSTSIFVGAEADQSPATAGETVICCDGARCAARAKPTAPTDAGRSPRSRL